MWILFHVELSGCPSESLRRAALNPELKVQASQHFIMGQLIITAFTLQALLPGAMDGLHQSNLSLILFFPLHQCAQMIRLLIADHVPVNKIYFCVWAQKRKFVCVCIGIRELRKRDVINLLHCIDFSTVS